MICQQFVNNNNQQLLIVNFFLVIVSHQPPRSIFPHHELVIYHLVNHQISQLFLARQELNHYELAMVIYYQPLSSTTIKHYHKLVGSPLCTRISWLLTTTILNPFVLLLHHLIPTVLNARRILATNQSRRCLCNDAEPARQVKLGEANQEAHSKYYITV